MRLETRRREIRDFETGDLAVCAGKCSLGGGAVVFQTEESRSRQRRPVGTSRGGRWFGPDLRSLSALRASGRLQELPRTHHVAAREQRQRQDVANSARDARNGFGPV